MYFPSSSTILVGNETTTEIGTNSTFNYFNRDTQKLLFNLVSFLVWVSNYGGLVRIAILINRPVDNEYLVGIFSTVGGVRIVRITTYHEKQTGTDPHLGAPYLLLSR